MKYLVAIFILFLLSGCRLTDRGERQINTDALNNPASEFTKDPDKMPVMSFEEPVFNFGTLSEGETINHSFEFVNEGKSPLVLSFVEGSCGCTVMKDWPKEPIAPGKKGEINVEFKSKGKKGIQNIAVRVVANTSPATSVLNIEGTVVTPN